MKSLGELMRQGRAKNGWSQAKLGELVGCSWHTVCMIETGSRATSMEKIEKISNVLELRLTPEQIRDFYTEMYHMRGIPDGFKKIVQAVKRGDRPAAYRALDRMFA